MSVGVCGADIPGPGRNPRENLLGTRFLDTTFVWISVSDRSEWRPCISRRRTSVPPGNRRIPIPGTAPTAQCSVKKCLCRRNSSIWHTLVHTCALHHLRYRARARSQSCRAHLHQCLMDRYTNGATSCVFFGSRVVVQVGPFKIALVGSTGAMRQSLWRYGKSH